MGRTLDFFDGFTSASQPNVSQNAQTVALLDNQTGTDLTGILFASASEDAVVFTAEVRLDATADLFGFYRVVFIYDGTNWSKQSHEIDGDDTGHIFDITAGTGQVVYDSTAAAGFVSANAKVKLDKYI
jgi:hypothetical protein